MNVVSVPKIFLLLFFFNQELSLGKDNGILGDHATETGDVSGECTLDTERLFVGINDIPSNFRACMDSGLGIYHCTDDPIGARRIFDDGRVSEFDGLYNMGLEQRIDGTETERDAIADVISRMVEYFYGEVLTKEVYEGVRDKCVNYYELCAFWAAVGECESNRKFMIPHCAAACRFCLLHQSEELEYDDDEED